ncbi:unannotated protein [freshwater metagenome]|uniref:Unannotated protein n=1 Tax=freshwater metagenome TaxID=449393 RepID=A0A6J7F7D1_9ZZZZ|nr:DUF3995 domain-containing protein [Actinomycetota bacterium]
MPSPGLVRSPTAPTGVRSAATDDRYRAHGGQPAPADPSTERTPPSSTASGTRLVLAAALAGTLHAAFSLYWASGGTWLLDTVGDWAVRLTDEHPVRAGLGLGLLGVAKLAAAWIPVLVAAGRLRGRTIWRRVAWTGGVGLILYGGLNTAVALLVVTGVLVPDGGYDPAAMLGHAALWDPLFLVWGGLLTAASWASRGSRAVDR